ncbi:MAG: fatty acid desaturase family protein [Rhodobiaceae bacterium]|jgi:fatty acid desaturase|nr:fatty acid desaturase family protein [Rhodobiaceae bacterium]MBT7280175.1 fatty acid desaturase family protein [Rhodobiaceae bacterium]MDG2495483.1 fatty acid desaturase family protein [Alphaproteobacteria bacterium]
MKTSPNLSSKAAPKLRYSARELVRDPKVLDKLQRRSNLIGLALVAHSWAMIFGAMALFYVLPNPITFLLAIAIIGARQLGLAILMHDAAHNALFRTLSWNNWLSDALCGHPMMARTDAYRRYHLVHHMNTQQDSDPDLILSKPFPITRKSLRRKLIRDLTGQTGYQQRKAQIIQAFGPKGLGFFASLQQFNTKLGGALLANLIILAICSAVFHWSYYLIFWLLPFLTYHMAITRLRNIAEHAIVPDNDDPFRSSRTTRANGLARIFIAPYWVNYHVEHHLLMHVPCYRLPLFEKTLAAAGLAEKRETAPGYFNVLRRATSRSDSEDGPGDIVHNGRNRLKGNFTDGFSQDPAAS